MEMRGKGWGGSTLGLLLLFFSLMLPLREAQAQTTVDLYLTQVAPGNSNGGDEITYTVRMQNNGPANADGATFINTLPPQVTFISSECLPTDAFNGAVCPTGVTTTGTLATGVQVHGTIATLPDTGTVVFRIKARLPYRGPGTFLNKAEIFAPANRTETNKTTNYAEGSTPVGYPLVDLVSRQLSYPTAFSVGDTLTYVVEHENQGPGSAGGGVDDIRLVVATNINPLGNTTGIRFVNRSVTCVPSGGATCPAAYPAGVAVPLANLDVSSTSSMNMYSGTVNVWPAGGKLTMTLTTTVESYLGAACGPTGLRRDVRATSRSLVGLGLTDSNTTNNDQMKEATGTVVPRNPCPNMDVQAEKSEPVAGYQLDLPKEYRIVYTNHGPGPADGGVISDLARLVNTLGGSGVTGLAYDSGTVSCTSIGGAVCPTFTLPGSGAGTISTSSQGNLFSGTVATWPEGGKLEVVYRFVPRRYVRAACGPSLVDATGQINNMARAAVPAGYVDPVPSNNDSTVNTTAPPPVPWVVCPRADLESIAEVDQQPLVFGQPMTLTFRHKNLGPDAADHSTVRGVIRAVLRSAGNGITGITYENASLRCRASDGAVCPDLPAVAASRDMALSDYALYSGLAVTTWPSGGELVFEYTFTPTAYTGACTGADARAYVRWTSTHGIATGITDANTNNNTDSVNSQPGPYCVDLGVAKDVQPKLLEPNQDVSFWLDVSVPPMFGTVPNVLLEDVLPAGFVFDGAAANMVCSVILGTGDCTGTPTWDPATRKFSVVIPSIANGDTVRYELKGKSIGYSSTWFNTARITPPATVWDPLPKSNSSTVNMAVVDTLPRVTKQSLDESKAIKAGQPVKYRITVSNPLTGNRVTDVRLTDVLQHGFTYLSTDKIEYGGTVTRTSTNEPTVGSAQLEWGTFDVSAGGSVTLEFTASTPGTLACGATVYSNSARVDYLLAGMADWREFDGNLIGNETDDVTIPCPPVLTKAMAPVVIASRGTATLTFTLTPPPNSADNTLPMSFEDNLPSGIEILNATVVVATNTCGATVTKADGSPLTAGTTSVRISDARLRDSGKTACTVVLNVTNKFGQFNPSCSANPPAFTNGPGNMANLDNAINGVQNTCLQVNELPVTLGKGFGPLTIQTGDTSTATLTFTQPARHPATTVSLTDTLPAGIQLASPLVIGGSCNGNNVAPHVTATGNMVTVSSLPLADNLTSASTKVCTVTFAVTNAPGQLNPTCSGNPANFSNGPNNVGNRSSNLSAPNTACLTVLSSPQLDKRLADKVIVSGQSTELILTIRNGIGEPAQSGINFYDNLPVQWRIANDQVSNTCGGTVTGVGTAPLAAEATRVTLTGGSLASGQTSCEIVVNVKNNSTSLNNSCAANPVAFTNNNANIAGLANLVSRVAAPQCLMVLSQNIDVAKSFLQGGAPVSRLEAGPATVDVRLVLTNRSNAEVTGFELVDVLPAASDTQVDGMPRNSTRNGLLSGAIAGLPTGVTATYSTQPNPCRSTAEGQNTGGTLLDLPAGCTAPNWQSSVADYSTVRAVRFVGAGLTIASTASLTLDFPMALDPANVAGDRFANDVVTTFSVEGGVPAPAVIASNVAVLNIAMASMSGLVYDDINLNGSMDVGEAGLAGALVVVTCEAGPSCVPGTEYSMRTTADGSYSFAPGASTVFANADGSGTAMPLFPGLQHGTWSLTEVPPVAPNAAVYSNTGSQAGTGTLPPGTAAGRQITGIGIGVGDTADGYLFGEVLLKSPELGKAFAPATILLGETSTMTWTLRNPNIGQVATLTTPLVDTMPVGMTVTDTPVSQCGGTVTVSGGMVTLSAGAQIPAATQTAAGECTVTMSVTSTVTGVNTIAAGALQTTVGNQSTDAAATLTVLSPGTLTVTKVVTPATVNVVGDFPFTVSCQTPAATYAGTVPVTAGNTGSTVVAVPAGSTNCTVTETVSALPAAPASYQWQAPVYVQPPAGAAAPGGALTARITNPLQGTAGALTISLVVEDAPKGFMPDPFAVYAICDKPVAGSRYPASGTLSLSVNAPVSVADIPVDASCVVMREASGTPAVPSNHRWRSVDITQPIGVMQPGGSLAGAVIAKLVPLDPPFAQKSGKVVKGKAVEWQLLLVNDVAGNAGQPPMAFELRDPLPPTAGMTYAGGSVSCVPTGAGQTKVTRCEFDLDSNTLIVTGELAHDAAADAASAAERIEVSFQAEAVQTGTLTNTASVSLVGIPASERTVTASVDVGGETVVIKPVPLWDWRAMVIAQALMVLLAIASLKRHRRMGKR